ncbi:phage fiber-tail adaptor protein [Limnoglobus roseus]|uniref:Uncharacterized protein n=1 Tax=Limnoglobus roseus TaxID=2598579 RepID=A0A5C1AKK6_9BACT|nr:hypothetical protein [Limnoglobus roseus]QEL18697.1 hypothetical protein PX52LOC_05733 [Limnoglobus roseus]
MTTCIQETPQGQIAVVEKTPGETEDVQIDWSTRGLGNDTIATSVWQVTPPSMTINSPAATIGTPATSTTVWLGSGASGTSYIVTNTITTLGGRTLEESFVCNVIPYRVIGG